jgi:hypothetical protein
MTTKYIDTLISEAMLIEAESAKDAGTLGYMARAMVQATMPHKNTDTTHHQRSNGDYRLTMVAYDPEIGLPYGSIPRLMLAWIGSEVVKTQEREIVLGDSMSAFMRELGLIPTGGRWGSIDRLKDQSLRLTSCAISCSFINEEQADTGPEPFRVGRGRFWWNPKLPDQLDIFKSTIELSEPFYNEIVQHPVPVDMRVLRMLKRSPMALDVYVWLTYRIYTLNRSRRRDVLIPWESLQMQFGAGYPETPQGKRDFKKSFLRELVKVKALAYNDARVGDDKAGLTLKQSPLHLPTRPPKKPHETI